MEVAQLSHPRSILDPPDAPTAPAEVVAPLAPISPFNSALRQLLESNPEFCRYRERGSTSLQKPTGLVDFLIAGDDEPHEPDEVFGRLRWGGQIVYLTRNRANMDGIVDRFEQRGYVALRGPGVLRTGPLRFLGLGRRVHYFIARKVLLTRPREITDRFTYHVRLVPPPKPQMVPYATNGCVVLKEVPSVERVKGRLRAKFADVSDEVIEKRARKFTEKIFPLFLTREAALLKILQRDLPPQYASRVPTLLDTEKDSRGYVRRMWMTWLRNGGQPLPHSEFARQSADLLRVVHELSGIIHLDLRLDNFVITEQGVGFVDFGSGVRVGENIHGNPTLSPLFEELMRTSQIQRMLDRMKNTGSLTSYILCDAHGKVDKAVDLFYLAVQIKQPISNPDITDFIKFEPNSKEAVELARLTEAILRPANPGHPTFRSAADVLEGICRVEAKLGKGTPLVVIEKYG
jgi:hypothetical protein